MFPLTISERQINFVQEASTEKPKATGKGAKEPLVHAMVEKSTCVDLINAITTRA